MQTPTTTGHKEMVPASKWLLVMRPGSNKPKIKTIIKVVTRKSGSCCINSPQPIFAIVWLDRLAVISLLSIPVNDLFH